MRIGFDAKRAVQNFTGLGNYSRYIVEILARYYPDNSYILYAPRKRSNGKLASILAENNNIQTVYPSGKLWKKLSTAWRTWKITQAIRNDGVDIYHGLSNELPLNSSHSDFKKVVTIHDLIFIRYPEYYQPIDRKIYTYKFRKACIDADKVIAISECTRRDIVHFFKIPEEKIEVVYQNSDLSFTVPFTNERKNELKEKYKLPARFVLNVGSIEERKNVLLAVKAMMNVPDDVHLVIVGKRTAYTGIVEKFVDENGLKERVHIFHNVPFEDLPGIYQLADIFIYPSRFEGFGIPIVEALHSGVPVIGATGSCLEEAGGPDSVYVGPDDVESTSEAINRILLNPAIRDAMIRKGKHYVKRFSDEEIAKRVMDLYRSL